MDTTCKLAQAGVFQLPVCIFYTAVLHTAGSESDIQNSIDGDIGEVFETQIS